MALVLAAASLCSRALGDRRAPVLPAAGNEPASVAAASPQGDPPAEAPAKAPEPAPGSNSPAFKPPSAAKPPPGEPAPAGAFRPALDPVPDDPCSIYGFDGITLGMKAADLSAMDGVMMSPASEENDFGWRYVFKARRPGRLDDVRIAVSGEGEETVSHIKATIAVARGDPWPNSIFTVGGNPRKARVTEWIWWSSTCKATMRLTQIESLGGSSKIVPYVLEARVYP